MHSSPIQNVMEKLEFKVHNEELVHSELHFIFVISTRLF